MKRKVENKEIQGVRGGRMSINLKNNNHTPFSAPYQIVLAYE